MATANDFMEQTDRDAILGRNEPLQNKLNAIFARMRGGAVTPPPTATPAPAASAGGWTPPADAKPKILKSTGEKIWVMSDGTYRDAQGQVITPRG